MNTLYEEFQNSMSRIKDNFMLSFLSINFINQKPFEKDIFFDVNFNGNSLSKELINSVQYDTIQEYGNSIRRHFLNDMVIAYERYASLMYLSNKKGKIRLDAANFDKNDSSRYHEFIYGLCNKKDFLKNIVSLRNSIVHYNGVYNVSNSLNYTFGNKIYQSSGKNGENISITFDNLLWIYKELIDTVKLINDSYFLLFQTNDTFL